MNYKSHHCEAGNIKLVCNLHKLHTSYRQNFLWELLQGLRCYSLVVRLDLFHGIGSTRLLSSCTLTYTASTDDGFGETFLQNQIPYSAYQISKLNNT